MSPTGRTKDGTWQLGVRRTQDGASVGALWDRLAVDPGALLGVPVALEVGATGVRDGVHDGVHDGVDVRVKSLTPAVVVRLAWYEQGWERESSVQVRVLPAANGATVSLAHEGLPDQETRARLLPWWTERVETWLAEG